MISVGRTKLRVDDVRRAVQVAMRVKREDIMCPLRHRRFAWPRQLVMTLAHELGCASTTKIGMIFQKDHTTVLHARQAVKARAEASKPYQQDIDAIRLSLLVYKAQIRQAEWPWPKYPAEPRQRRTSAFTHEPAPAEAFAIDAPMPSALARAA